MGTEGKHFRIYHVSLCVFVTIKKSNISLYDAQKLCLKFALIATLLCTLFCKRCACVCVGGGGGQNEDGSPSGLLLPFRDMISSYLTI